jgi:hypothetical protein
MNYLLCSLLALFALLHGANGWWDTGHMLVAQIAWKYLNQTNSTLPAIWALENAVNSLVTYKNNSNTFVTAACWMDDLKNQGMHQFDNWHFINLPICDFNDTITDSCDGISVGSVLGDSTEEDVLWGIDYAASTISSPASGGFERGFALRNLLHFVGDIHQPLHAVARYCAETPYGDEGGNLFPIQNVTFNGQAINNLHKLWDSGLGRLNNSIVRPLNTDEASYLSDMADWIINQTANITALEPSWYNVTQWAMDSRELAILYVYNLTFNSTPSQEYLDASWPIVVQQLGLGGYRLNQVLRRIYNCSDSLNNCPDLNPPKDEEALKWTIVAIALAVVLGGSLLANAVLTYSVCSRRSKDNEETTPLRD